MYYREFGPTKVKISSIGMGTYYGRSYEVLGPFVRLQGGWRPKKAALDQGMNIFRGQSWQERALSLRKGLSFLYDRGNITEKIAALRKGLELGVNLIDTAELYQTEDIVAEAIKGYKRADLFIATKVSGSHLRYHQVLEAANNSLTRLQSSYIDLFQIHGPNSGVPIEQTMKAMEKLVKDGKVRYIGVSNFSVEQMERAEQTLSNNKIASNQVEYNLLERGIERDLLQYCELKNIAILAYQPIARGVLAYPNPKTKKELEAISQKHGCKTPAQIALNWLISKSRIIFPIPRASRPKHIIEDVGSIGWRLDPEEMKRIEKSIAPR